MAPGMQARHDASMTRRAAIPLHLDEDPEVPGIEIDAARVARGLGLQVAWFRKLMDEHRITVLCERGTGEDAGRWRITWYHDDRRLRLVVDAQGNVLGEG